MVLINFLKNKKKELLLKKIELLKESAREKGRFSMFNFNIVSSLNLNKMDYANLNYFYNLIKNYDDQCNIPYDIGAFLDRIAQDYTIMIHRTKINQNEEETGLHYNVILKDIMNDGLKNNGHIMSSGGKEQKPLLTLTLTPLTGLAGYINLVTPYKSNDVVVIAAFPKNLVDENGNIVNKDDYSKIYDESEITPKIRPEYIIGALLKKKNGLDEYYSREEILDKLRDEKHK